VQKLPGALAPALALRLVGFHLFRRVHAVPGNPASHSLTVSDERNNCKIQTIPEPATWTMGLAGFGLLVLARRRRRA
jgi:MYXO-CTERM domain-containing protein